MCHTHRFGIGSALLPLLLAAGPARAATYTVDPAGDDTAAGSAAAPWATLQHAADRVAPGDEVIVRDGSYAGFVLGTGGTETARIVFRAEADGAVITSGMADGPFLFLDETSWVTLEGFRLEGITDQGIAAGRDGSSPPLAGLEIRGNTLIASETDPGVGGIILVGCTGAVVEENILQGFTVAAVALPGTVDSDVRTNVVRGPAAGAEPDGLRLERDAGAGAWGGIRVVNNTVHLPAGAGWGLRAIGDPAAPGEVIAFNNLFLHDGDEGGAVWIDGAVDLKSARNGITDRFIADGGTVPVTLGVFQAAGYESGSLATEALRLFVDTASGDYKLRAGCPAVNMGLPVFEGVVAPDHDLRGIPRPVASTHDLGAYEFCTGWTCEGGDGGDVGDGGEDAPGDTAGDAGTGGGDDGGCGCRIGARSPVGSLFLLFGLVAVALRRYGKRRR